MAAITTRSFHFINNISDKADETLSRIGQKAIAEGNLSLAERAAKKMTFASNTDYLMSL